MNKAVFLDRDGVLNRERGGYTYLPEHLLVNEGVTESLKEFQRRGYLLIIITNQGGIAKGMYRHSDVYLMYDMIAKHLSAEGVKIDAMFYCPHHGEIMKCLCRKPLSLLLEKAIARYNIDPKKSYFIGDHERDQLAGNAAGVQSILVPSNSDLRNIMHKIA